MPAPTLAEPPRLCCLLSNFAVSCRLSMFRSPPMSVTTRLPLTTPPRMLVSPPLLMLTLSAPLTWLLTWVTSLPSALPLAPLALAVNSNPSVP